MACFDVCDCVCFEDDRSKEFDRCVLREMRNGPSLDEIVGNHAGWYQDGREGRENRDVETLGLRGVPGVYILWRQSGYCQSHDAEHLTAEYVGKSGSSISARLLRHQLDKSINDVLTTEISLWRCTNRIAKYLEQALLDHFTFPQNRNEVTGSRRLCHHIRPAAWN